MTAATTNKNTFLAEAAEEMNEELFPQFKSQVDQWVGDQLICAYKFDKKNDRVIVVTEEDDPNAGVMSVRSVYSVYRMFRYAAASGWATSVDLQQGQGSELAEKMLSYL